MAELPQYTVVSLGGSGLLTGGNDFAIRFDAVPEPTLPALPGLASLVFSVRRRSGRR